MHNLLKLNIEKEKKINESNRRMPERLIINLKEESEKMENPKKSKSIFDDLLKSENEDTTSAPSALDEVRAGLEQQKINNEIFANLIEKSENLESNFSENIAIKILTNLEKLKLDEKIKFEIQHAANAALKYESSAQQLAKLREVLDILMQNYNTQKENLQQMFYKINNDYSILHTQIAENQKSLNLKNKEQNFAVLKSKICIFITIFGILSSCYAYRLGITSDNTNAAITCNRLANYEATGGYCATILKRYK